MQSFSKTKLKFKMCSYVLQFFLTDDDAAVVAAAAAFVDVEVVIKLFTVEKKSLQQNIYSSKSLIDLFSPGG